MKRPSWIRIAGHLLLALFGSEIATADGVASTAHPLATKTAEGIFDSGGNAADAAIAVSFVLSVVEPTLSGLGGRAQALVRTADGGYHGYNGMTEIPAVFRVDDQAEAYGYTTIATPGLIALLGLFTKLMDPCQSQNLSSQHNGWRVMDLSCCRARLFGTHPLPRYFDKIKTWRASF